MDIHSIIRRPIITEKGSILAEKNAYVFEVSERSTKNEIKKAIQKIYEVMPKKVNVVTVPAKNVFVRGRVGKKPGYKKAIVYLNKGDKIESV